MRQASKATGEGCDGLLAGLMVRARGTERDVGCCSRWACYSSVDRTFGKGRCALTQWPKTSYSPSYFLLSHFCANKGRSRQNDITEIKQSHLECCALPQGQASSERGACALHSKVEPRGTATARESDAERALGAYAFSFGRFASPTKCRYSAARTR